MKKTIEEYKCDECHNGIVKTVRIETKTEISFDIKDCNKCKKPHGFKSLSKLEEIKKAGN